MSEEEAGQPQASLFSEKEKPGEAEPGAGPIRNPGAPCLAPHVRVQTDRVSGKPALLYPEGILLLNPTGQAIVALLDGHRTLAEIVEALAARYNAPKEQLEPDVTEYLNRLRERNLLVSQE